MAIRPQLGRRYLTDQDDVVMTIIREIDDGPFCWLARAEDGSIHKYTEKGRYFHGFGNHPLHLKKEDRRDPKELFDQMNQR